MPPRCCRRRVRLPQCMMSDGGTRLLSFILFSHNGTIKRFPRIAFPFAGFPLSCAFVNNGLGSLLLMIPNGFGDPIPGFENPERQARPNTPHLTPSSFGGSATSGRRAFAFASRGHPASTSTTHGFGDGGRTVPWFYSFFTDVGPVHGLGHGLGLGGVAVDPRCASRCGAPTVAHPLHTQWSPYWYA